MNNFQKKKIKVIFIGDSECGKTALLSTFVKDIFPEAYESTVFNSLSSEVEIEGEIIELSFWDTSGQSEFDHIRPLSYQDTDVIVICFDISRPETLENVYSKWSKEAKEMCSGKPSILVGCKSDCRSEKKLNTDTIKSTRMPSTYKQGNNMSKAINSEIYLECSAKEKDRLQDIFELCVLVALKKPFRKKNYKPKTITSENSLQKKSKRCIVA